MNTKFKKLVILIIPVLLLTVINAAWIFSYERTITAEIIGEMKSFTISKTFDNDISLNTTDGPASISTYMKIENLKKDMNVSYDIKGTSPTRLNLSCTPYTNDCDIIVTYNNTADGAEKNLTDGGSFIILKEPDINFINYKIACVENSCPQRINATITIEEIKTA